MWISRKEWEALKKRIADLEGQVQSQQYPDAQEGVTLICNHKIDAHLVEIKTDDF